MKTHIERIVENEKFLLSTAPKSYEQIEILLADELIEIGSSGKIYSKQDVIKALSNEKTREIEAFDFNARKISEDIILLTYRSIVNYPQSQKKQETLRSSLWKYTKKSWQIIFHQGTLLSL